MTTNIVTPPDFVEDRNHTVLIIDAAPEDVETLAFLCGNHDESFNIYLYKTDMNDIDWLTKAAKLADAVLINTEPTAISSIKDELTYEQKAWHYGPKRFLGNDRRHNTILDYFVIRAKSNEETV